MKNLPNLGKPTRQGYRQSKGYVIQQDRMVQKTFWLGHDPAVAVQKIAALEEIANAVTPTDGKLVWAEDALARVTAAFEAIDGRATTIKVERALPTVVAPPSVAEARPVVAPEPPPLPAPPMTLHQGFDAFVEHTRRRWESKDGIGEETYRQTVDRIGSLKERIADRPLGDIRYEHLVEMRQSLTCRPLCRRLPKEGETANPVSVQTVDNWLSMLGMAFRWLDKFDRWIPPRHWQEVFVLTKAQRLKLMTPEELDEEGKPKPIFNVEELKVLYKNGSPSNRRHLLMGIMLGWAQEAIKSFRKNHLVTINGEYYIDRRRNKTGVPGFWWVCPELAAMIVKGMSKTPKNEGNLAFLTENGLPLVRRNAKGTIIDTIRLDWVQCLNRAPKGKVRRLPFGRLRKTGSQMIRNIGGEFFSQLFLAQVPKNVANTHYNDPSRTLGLAGEKSDFDRLHDYQRQMYDQLKAAGLFDAGDCARGRKATNPTPMDAGEGVRLRVPDLMLCTKPSKNPVEQYPLTEIP